MKTLRWIARDSGAPLGRWTRLPAGRASGITAYQGCGQTAPGEAVGVAVRRNPAEVLHDNEIVIMMVRPSMWYVAAISLRMTAILLLAALLIDRTGLAGRFLDERSLWSVAGILVAVRWVYALINWLSQLYLLTNHRIVVLRGATKVEIFQVGLCRITEARLMSTPLQRLLGTGNIGFATGGDILPQSVWLWVANAPRVHQQILQALSKR